MATSNIADFSDEAELRRARQFAEEALGLKFDQVVRAGSEANMLGIQSEHVLFSRRLDSRTYFAQDARYGIGRQLGVFEGSDDELVQTSRGLAERIGLPLAEIHEAQVVTEQTQVGQLGADGVPRLEEVQAGKKMSWLTRRIEGLPVWSSSVVLGLTRERQIGFLQVHWPDIPGHVVEEARKLEFLITEGWRPPEKPGATVESFEAGITHSPALGFILDIYPAIRVIYSPSASGFGRKMTLYVDRHGNDVPLPRQLDLKPEPPAGQREPGQPAGEEGVERHRSHFRALLLSNPNFFGTVEGSPFKAELPLQKDTSYEEIGCVGYEPQLRRLEVVVYVNRPFGYGGDVCSSGTPEFVRFYLSFDDGVTWQDQGMSSFTAYDIPGPKPLEYDITLGITPPERFCFSENLPRVRAILSWNNAPPPNTPNFPPVWGDVKESRIQIRPRNLFLLSDLLSEAKVQLPSTVQPLLDPSLEVQAAKPMSLSVSELHALYEKADVPGHRYLSTHIQQWLETPQIALSQASAFTGSLAGLGINLGDLVGGFLSADGDTTFEQLDCLGLNPNDDSLIGVIHLKRPSGYSGGLCSAGSQEFVAFWADFGSGWTYQGTTSVNVHDLTHFPSPDGLQYAVVLPVNLAGHRRPCDEGATTARVRAILSWNTVPPPGNPNYVPRWGNRRETLIHIRPGRRVEGQVPFLSAVGDMPESHISASGVGTGVTLHTGFVGSDSPFGGTITLAGHISNATAGLKYRIMRKPHGAPDTSYTPLTNEPVGLDLVINTWDPINGWVQTSTTVHADTDGYYPFEDYSSNHSVESNIIGRWFSNVAEDGNTYDVRMDLSTDGNPAHDVHSNAVAVLIDNTPPEALLSIDLGVGGQCADFDRGAVFTGHFTATDIHFGSYSFEILPSGPPNDPPHGVLPTPASGNSVFYMGTVADPGVVNQLWTLNTGLNPGPPPTGPMDACGYALVLHVYDRTNVNSGGGSHHTPASAGFCLRSPMM